MKKVVRRAGPGPGKKTAESKQFAAGPSTKPKYLHTLHDLLKTHNDLLKTHRPDQPSATAFTQVAGTSRVGNQAEVGNQAADENSSTISLSSQSSFDGIFKMSDDEEGQSRNDRSAHPSPLSNLGTRILKTPKAEDGSSYSSSSDSGSVRQVNPFFGFNNKGSHSDSSDSSSSSEYGDIKNSILPPSRGGRRRI